MNEIFVAFDVETTGFSPGKDKIVDMAAVKFRANGEIVDSFESLTTPGVPIPAAATQVHRITDDMVVGKPSPLQAWESILDWVDEPLFVAHNAPFDFSFVKNLGSRHVKMPEIRFIDTLRMSRDILDCANCELDVLEPRPPEQSHRALYDAKAVVRLFCRLATKIKDLSPYIKSISNIRKGKPTSRQVGYIRALGGDPASVNTRQEASEYIKKLKGARTLPLLFRNIVLF